MFNYPLQTILVLWSLAWGRRIYFKNCQWLVSDLSGEGKKKIMTQIFYGVPKQRKKSFENWDNQFKHYIPALRFRFLGCLCNFVTWAHSTNRWHHPVSSHRTRDKFQNSEISQTFLHYCLSKVMFYATKVILPSTDTLVTLMSVSKVIILVNIFTFVISVSFQDGGHKQNDRLHPFWYTVAGPVFMFKREARRMCGR